MYARSVTENPHNKFSCTLPLSIHNKQHWRHFSSLQFFFFSFPPFFWEIRFATGTPTTSALVPPIRVPRRLTTWWLIKLLTSFEQPTKWKHNRWLGAGDRGQWCGDIELSGYLTNGPVSLVLDLYITHERFGSINGHLHYLNDLNRLLNETVTDKIRQYHTDYNNRSSNTISFMPDITSTSGCLHNDRDQFHTT